MPKRKYLSLKLFLVISLLFIFSSSYVAFAQFAPAEVAMSAEIEEFLKTAKIVKSEDIGEGVTNPKRLYLQGEDKFLLSLMPFSLEGASHVYSIYNLKKMGVISDLGESNGKDTARNPIRTHRLISGLGLAVIWTATVIVDLMYDDGYREFTLIPVIGPFITIGIIESKGEEYWPGAKGLLILSGLAQSIFATYFVISLTSRPKPRKKITAVIYPTLNSINLKILF